MGLGDNLHRDLQDAGRHHPLVSSLRKQVKPDLPRSRVEEKKRLFLAVSLQKKKKKEEKEHFCVMKQQQQQQVGRRRPPGYHSFIL